MQQEVTESIPNQACSMFLLLIDILVPLSLPLSEIHFLKHFFFLKKDFKNWLYLLIQALHFSYFYTKNIRNVYKDLVQ